MFKERCVLLLFEEPLRTKSSKKRYNSDSSSLYIIFSNKVQPLKHTYFIYNERSY